MVYAYESRAIERLWVYYLLFPYESAPFIPFMQHLYITGGSSHGYPLVGLISASLAFLSYTYAHTYVRHAYVARLPAQ